MTDPALRDPAQPARIRVDKWLWHARFFKSRTLAAEMVAGGTLRLNGQRIAKPAQTVGAGDILSFPQGGRLVELRVLACGTRRGPAPEARTLYIDLSPRLETPASPV